MGKISAIVVLQLSSWASFIGLYLTIFPLGTDRPTWHWILLVFTTLATAGLIIRDVRDHLRNSPKFYKTEKSINDYMRRWVSSGGRAVIFSRDMSWAHELETKTVLFEKARRNELTICAEQSVQLTEELKAAGATVVYYGHLGHIPRSRFTIIDFEREGARVAVGAKLHGRHAIQEYRDGEHPFFGVAEDLVKILKALE